MTSRAGLSAGTCCAHGFLLQPPALPSLKCHTPPIVAPGRVVDTQPRLVAAHAVAPSENRRIRYARGWAKPPAQVEEPLPSLPAADNPFVPLGVDPLLLAGLTQQGITSPSPIQAAAVPAILAGHNVAVQSYTGSGKTLAFLLPALSVALQRGQALAAAKSAEVPVQALVVAPSQELAMQILRAAQALLPTAAKQLVQQCIGGANPRRQQEALDKHRPLVVVGTPGRMAEFANDGLLKLHQTPLMILDEADQLLAPQFSEDMACLHAHCGRRLAEIAQRRQAAAARPEADPLRDLLPGSDAHITPAAPPGGHSGSAGGAAVQRVRREPNPLALPPAPNSRQTVIVSATLSESVLARMKAWCPDPRYITAGGPAPMVVADEVGDSDRAGDADDGALPGWGWGAKGWDGPAALTGPRTTGSAGGVEGSEGLVPCMPPQLQHYYMVVDGQKKVDGLRRLVHAMDAQRALVFMNWQQRLRDVQFKLGARSMEAGVLHGEMPKVARHSVLQRFRKGDMRVLVVSDVMARGLDIPDCDTVFHLELPSSAAHYAHRAGRTGRMGATGRVVSLVPANEVWVLGKLSDKLGVPFQEVHVAFGELRPGPPPEDGSEHEHDAPAGQLQAEVPQARQGSSGAGSSQQSREAPAAVKAHGLASLAGSTSSGSSSRSSSKHGSDSSGRATDRSASASSSSSSSSSSSTAAVVKVDKAEVDALLTSLGAKKARAVSDAQGELEIYDDEDEIELEDDEEDDDPPRPGSNFNASRDGAALQPPTGMRGRRGRPPGRAASDRPQRSGPVPAPAKPTGHPSTRGDAEQQRKGSGGGGGGGGGLSRAEELRRELDELRAEKAALRAAAIARKSSGQ